MEPVSMSVRALLRRAASPGWFVRSPCRMFYKTQPACSKRDHEKLTKKRKKEAVDTGQALVYNPSAYYQTRLARSACSSDPLNEEEASPQTILSTSVRQQTHQYTISNSRCLSSTENSRVSLESPTQSNPSNKSNNPKDIQVYLKRDARAFQKCRPEYQKITYDSSQRPPSVPVNDGLLLLHQVALRKGSMQASEIAHVLCELGCLDLEQTSVIRGSMRFSELMRCSVENLQNFTDLQLVEVLQAFVRLDLSHSNSMLGLYEAEFIYRADGMSLHQLLFVGDLWRCLGRSVPRYVEKLCDCICEHFDRMGPAELVQFMYILGESRQCPLSLLQPLEGLLLHNLDKLKGEEVSAVCLGLFKTQSPVSEATARRIVDQACRVVGEISDFGLVNVLKLMRFSHLDHLPWLEELSSQVPQRAPKMAVQGLMHVALTCSALHYRSEPVLLAVAEHLPHPASYYRSKDAAKLLWAFGNLGMLPSKCPSFYPRLTEVLRERESEFRSYPEHLLTALLGLAFVGQFPYDLLTMALSPEFGNQVSSALDLNKDLFTLDGTVELELPGWTGPRLNPTIRDEVTKRLWDFAAAELGQKPEVLEAERVLQELLGGRAFVQKRMILPHMRSVDLEVHLDASGQPLSPPSSTHLSSAPETCWPQGWEQGHTGVTLTDDLLAQLKGGKHTVTPRSPAPCSQQPLLRLLEAPIERESIRSVGVDLSDNLLIALTKPRGRTSVPGQGPPRPKVLRLAVQVTSRNHYCYRTQQLMGLHAMKRRQLMVAGYTVLEIPHWEWFPLLKRSLTERLAYMHCKIFNSYDLKQKRK